MNSGTLQYLGMRISHHLVIRWLYAIPTVTVTLLTPLSAMAQFLPMEPRPADHVSISCMSAPIPGPVLDVVQARASVYDTVFVCPYDACADVSLTLDMSPTGQLPEMLSGQNREGEAFYIDLLAVFPVS